MTSTHLTGTLQTFTDENFQTEVLASEVPVLVDFWADWCPPCQMLTPTIEQVATSQTGSAVVGKLHVDENPKVASEYGVSSIPTVLVFKHGEVVERIVGVQPRNKYEQAIGS